VPKRNSHAPSSSSVLKCLFQYSKARLGGSSNALRSEEKARREKEREVGRRRGEKRREKWGEGDERKGERSGEKAMREKEREVGRRGGEVRMKRVKGYGMKWFERDEGKGQSTLQQ
jgi:hypothetical protein